MFSAAGLEGRAALRGVDASPLTYDARHRRGMTRQDPNLTLSEPCPSPSFILVHHRRWCDRCKWHVQQVLADPVVAGGVKLGHLSSQRTRERRHRAEIRFTGVRQPG